MIAKERDGKFTVVSANGFIVNQEIKPKAISILKAHGLSHLAAERLLTTKVSDAEWRATFIQASAAVALACEATLADAASTAEVDEVRQRQDTLQADVAELAEQVEAQRRAEEIEQLRTFQESEYARLCVAFGRTVDAYAERTFREHLTTTRAGRRLAELEAA